MYKYGTRVRVSLPERSDAITIGLKAYNGKEAMVERAYYFAGANLYELYGVVSSKGKAYTLEEDWLEPIGKEQNDEHQVEEAE